MEIEKVTLGIKGTDASTYLNLESTIKLKRCYVSEVVSGSAREKAGVKSGDIITKIDDTDLS
ncbi:MAG: PDZ domain-containing protein [Clostridium perfringens]